MTLNAIISHVEVRISVYLHICILVCMLATVRSCLFLEPLFCVFSVPALTRVKGTFFCFDNYLYIYKKEERLSTLTAGKHVHLLLCQRFSNPGPWTSVGPSTNGFWSVEYWLNTNFPPNYFIFIFLYFVFFYKGLKKPYAYRLDQLSLVCSPEACSLSFSGRPMRASASSGASWSWQCSRG